MMRKYGHLQAAFAFLMTIALAGCSGGGSDTSAVTTSAGSMVVTAAVLAPGAVCPNGGISVESGIDENLNGLLDSTEVDAVQYVCNGVDGIDGQTALVSISPEPAGANCAAGGSKVESGLDTSNDGMLDLGEVTHTSYVCDALDGSNGVDGLTTLLAITPEPAGVNCTYGGQLITSGLDADRDTILDPEEITATGYACSGAPAGIGWVEVTGTTQQAEANMGYFANGFISSGPLQGPVQVTITLPALLATGDVVQVVGTGAGGWKIAQNDGQFILGMANQRAMIMRDASSDWRALASSADGSRLVAVPYSEKPYVSTDSGKTWVQPFLVNGIIGRPVSVASSADGIKILMGTEGGYLYRSTDGGLSWISRLATVSGNWSGVASSTDGTKLLAANNGGYLYVSRDSGNSWIEQTAAGTGAWMAVASSADGTRLVAGRWGGAIYTSTDSGATWTAQTSIGNGYWYAIASSADGLKLATVSYGGGIYTSQDGGVTWTLRSSAGYGYWGSVTSSADGSVLIAAQRKEGIQQNSEIIPGHLFISLDSGATWTQQPVEGEWAAVVTSAYGNKIVAAVVSGNLYTQYCSTAPGIAGSLMGQQWDTVELQYVGAGTFMVRSYDGDLSFQ